MILYKKDVIDKLSEKTGLYKKDIKAMLVALNELVYEERSVCTVGRYTTLLDFQSWQTYK